MATLVAQSDWNSPKSAGTSFSVTLSHTPTIGNTLVFVSNGGAIATPASFTRRGSYAGGNQDPSIWDLVVSGTMTTVAVTLNGSGDNVGGTILEFSGSLTYSSTNNNGSGTSTSQSIDYQVATTSAGTVAAQSLMIATWAVAQGTAFSTSNQFRQMGPFGKIVRSSANQDVSGTAFIYAVGIADVDATHSYPASLSAGQYEATSVYAGASPGTTYALQVIYTDTSGVPTVTVPNQIVKENSLPGTDNSNWYLNTAGTDATIAGFVTTPSVTQGGTASFKVHSSGFTFQTEIYRLGWYGYDTFSARNVVGNQTYITGMPVTQPTPTVDGTLGSTSCVAWTVNATWSVPSDACPGYYYVIFRRTDAGNTTKAASCHFIVRESSVAGKIAVVSPTLTHHAYNPWGGIGDNGTYGGGTYTGRSIYQAGSDGGSGNFAHRAYAVCLDRPYATQSAVAQTYIFDSEFGWVVFMEAQGYNLTYLSDMDLENSPTILNSAALVAMIGHHEYWTTNVYTAFQNAIAAGVNVFVYSANTAGWRVRFAVGDTLKRTAICYKDSGTRDVSAGFTGTGYDPVSPTGTWRDPTATNGIANPDQRFDNALTGQRFVGSGPISTPLLIDFTVKTKPIWRNSSVVQALTIGNHYTDINNSLGYEVDSADGAAHQPTNLVIVASTSQAITTGANVAGTVYTTSTTISATWSLYRDYVSSALIFNVGTWRAWWSVARWTGSSPVANVSLEMQNALLAILYDLGQAPATLTNVLRPGVDSALTNPATGAPTVGNNNVALAYGLVLVNSISSSDTGSGLDSSTIVPSLSSPDTFSGVESGSVVVKAVSEIATGLDTAGAASATLSQPDVISGIDASKTSLSSFDVSPESDSTFISVSLSNSDTGSTAESNAVGPGFFSADSISGSDVSTKISLSSSDIVLGIDSSFILASLSSSDVGLGTESISISGSDTISALDFGTVLVLLANSDSSAGSESSLVFLPNNSVSSADGGSGLEAASVGLPTVFDIDVVSRLESGTISLFSSDTSSGLDLSLSGITQSISLKWNVDTYLNYIVFSVPFYRFGG